MDFHFRYVGLNLSSKMIMSCRHRAAWMNLNSTVGQQLWPQADGYAVVQGLFSNALVSKMVQKRMQGKAGLGTKMVVPRKRPQVMCCLQWQ